jgi:hypothetical protein
MSQCLGEDRDIAQKFPTAVYVSPKFPEEPPVIRKKLRRSSVKARVSNKAKVVADLRKQLETTIFRLLVTAQSKDQFSELRSELFPQFVELSGAISTLVPLPNEDPADIAEKVFAELAKQFAADSWLLTRLNGGKDEAQFCLETLHRAHFLAQDVSDGLKNGSLPPKSRENYTAAISDEWWSILHLRCIIFAIRHKISPTDEVLMSLMEGFRHSVMSYASARQAIEPRYRADYDSIDFASLTPDPGDYDPHDKILGV